MFIVTKADRRTRTYWHSLAQIVDRVIATIDSRPNYPEELKLTPKQGLLKMFEQIVTIRRTLKITDPLPGQFTKAGEPTSPFPPE